MLQCVGASTGATDAQRIRLLHGTARTLSFIFQHHWMSTIDHSAAHIRRLGSRLSFNVDIFLGRHSFLICHLNSKISQRFSTLFMSDFLFLSYHVCTRTDTS
jgi:hypothetical protein